MTLVSLAARLFFSLLLAGGVAAASAQPAAAGHDRRGFLYEIRKGEQRALLMGTIHVGRADWFPLPAAQQARLDRATRIVLEADLGRADAVAAAISSYALYPAGSEGLAGALPPAVKTRVAQAIAAAGIDGASAWRMKPWLLASTLALREAEAAGYSTQAAVESQLLAQARGRPVDELEGVELQ
ncbi:MAG: TraB/GumN family protein, partial [Burkholderiaceae bacterium]